MLSKLRDFKGLTFLRSLWSNEADNIFAPGICSIGIISQQLCLAYARHDNGKPELQFIEIYPFSKNAEFSQILNAAVKKHQLEGVSCTWVLPPERYQSILLDALPVAESEFQSAIRWKLKGILQYPETDVVIDSFPVPLQKTHDPRKMIVIVAAQISFLQPYANKIRESGLHLKTIDIQELALRNITSQYENDEKTTALIYLRESGSELIITSQKELYFHRHLDSKLSTINQADEHANPELDKAALELQRSFDYYQSQWRQPAPARVILATAGLAGDFIAKYLTSRLALPIQTFDIRSLIKSKQELSTEEQGRYLPVIGGLLREESAQHVATS